MSQSSDDLMTGADGADLREDMREIARGAGVSAWRQIADEVEADIAAGRFTAGSQLPTEAQLAARFAVNRHTVRRGLSELAQRGLVRATQGRGTFVEARPIPYPIGPRTRFSEIVSRAGREAGGKLLAAAVVSADARTAAALAIEAGSPVMRLDTLRSADGTPISLGSGFFPLPRFERFGDAYLAYGSITGALASRGVADYRRLETRISARPAGTEEAAHLDLAPGRLLLAVHSVNVDTEGTPIQFTRALFAADRTEIVVES